MYIKFILIENSCKMTSSWILHFAIEAKPDYVRYGRCIVILSLQWWWLIDFKLRSMVMDNRMCIDGIFIVHVCGLSNQMLSQQPIPFWRCDVLNSNVPIFVKPFYSSLSSKSICPVDEFYKSRYLTFFISRYFAAYNLWICRYI